MLMVMVSVFDSEIIFNPATPSTTTPLKVINIDHHHHQQSTLPPKVFNIDIAPAVFSTIR